MRFVPRDEISYIYFAIVVAFSTIIVGLTNHDLLAKYNSFLIMLLHSIAFFCATIFFAHKLWSDKIKQKYIGFAWYMAIFISLVYNSSTFVLLCDFSEVSLVVFMLNIIIVTMLLNSRIAIIMAFLGMSLGFVTYVIAGGSIESATASYKIEILSAFVIFTWVIIGFIKPKEEALAISEAKSRHLWDKVRDMDNGVDADKTLNKEAHIAMADILDFSSLTSLKLELNPEKVNLGELVKERLVHCQRIYLDGKKLIFELNIDKDVYTRCDLYHMGHTIDNLIINAIIYSRPETRIRICVRNVAGGVEFTIRDEGNGVPHNELFEIFKPFTVGESAKTPGGRRGIGLSLCYTVLANHSGRIWVESDGKNWAEFKFKL